MKKTIIMIFVAFLMSNISNAQNLILHIKNNSHMDLTYGCKIEHGLSGMLPGQIDNGQIKDMYFNPDILTGVEGLLSIFPMNQQNERIDIYYDNPLIGTGTYSIWSSNLLTCKPLKWDITVNSGRDCELTVEITNPTSTYGKPVPVVLNGNGTVKGSVFWEKNIIQSPETYPYGKAFTFKVLAPTQFIESNGPFTLEKAGIYNGKQGYYQGNKETGTVNYETIQTLNPNIVEVRYTITGVPTDVPIEMDVTTDYTKSKWLAGPQKIKPADDYVFVVGTFPGNNKTTITINNNFSILNGVDFNCDGDWLKVDTDGKITGGGAMVNKIAARKTFPVLQNEILSSTNIIKAADASNIFKQAKSATPTNQVQLKQVQGAVQKVRIKQ
ncbi:MAG: hypothetical protein ABIP30_12610 [Ferruginibacter sp.]